MRITKRILAVLLLIIPMTLGALGIETRVTGITMQPDFWEGVFPSGVSYMYEVSGLELIPGRDTSLGLELETGTLARHFTRIPETGRLLSTEPYPDFSPEGDPIYVDEQQRLAYEYNNYDTLYAGFNLLLRQGFLESRLGGDMVTVTAGLKGRWEISLNPILDFGTRSGYPFYLYPAFYDDLDYNVLPGTPDLSGNRQLVDIAFVLGGSFKSLLTRIAGSDGADVNVELMYSPKFTNLTKANGGRSDFFKVLLNSTEAFMLFSKTDEKNENLWSVGVSNSIAFRYLTGTNVPVYAEELNLPLGWYTPENTRFMVEDIIKLEYYGRQFFKYFVPKASLFLDLSYNWGKLNNVKEGEVSATELDTFCASAGVHVELLVAGKLSIYYEIGRVFAYTGPNADYYIGFRSSDHIKFSLSVEF